MIKQEQFTHQTTNGFPTPVIKELLLTCSQFFYLNRML